MLFVASALILSGDIDDAVGVNIEGDFDLRYAAACRSNAVQLETTQGLVAGCHFPFALEDMDFYRGLVICCGGEDLALLHGDGGVTVDQLGEHTAHGLDTQGQGGDIQQQQTLYIAAQDAALDGCTDCNTFIGVDALEAFLAGDLLDRFLNSGDTRGTAHQQNLMQVAGLQAGIGQSLTDRTHGSLHQVVGQFVELCTGDGHIQMLGAGGVCGDIRQVDVGGGDTRQLDLCLFSRFLQTLHSDLIGGQVDAVFLLKFSRQVIHDALIEVIAAQAVVAGGSQHFNNTIVDVQDGHVESAAAQVIDHDLLGFFFIHTISQSGSGGFVDDTLDFQTSDLACVLGGLTLSIGEVCRNRDDCFGDGLAQISFSIALQLLQDHCADLLRSILLAINGDLVVAAHLTLDGADGAVGVCDSLTLCHLAYHTFAVLGKCDDRGSGAVPFRIGDNDSFAAFHNGYAGVSSTQVNTNNLRHNVAS